MTVFLINLDFKLLIKINILIKFNINWLKIKMIKVNIY